MKQILTPISPGELIDKLTILELKATKIADPAKSRNVRFERDTLQRIADEAIPKSNDMARLRNALFEINADLWAIEDDIRKCEDRGDFGAGFIGLARAVYTTNDERARLKKEINLLLGSDLIEEKSYYAPDAQA